MILRLGLLVALVLCTIGPASAFFDTLASDGIARQDKSQLQSESIDTVFDGSIDRLLDCSNDDDSSRDAGDICKDRIGMAGLTLDDDSNIWAITTRGPVQQCGELATLSSDVNPTKYSAKNIEGEGFALPTFSPSVLKLAYDGDNENFKISRNAQLAQRSGLPPQDTENVYGFKCEGGALDRVQYSDGVSPGDIAINPYKSSRELLVADHYTPKLLSVDPSDGTVEKEQKAPDILTKYKLSTNSGFGAVASYSDSQESWALAVMASPLKTSDGSTARVVRGVLYNGALSDSDTKQVAVPLSSNRAYRNFAQQEEVRVVAAASIDSDSFLMLERTDDQAKLFVLNGMENADDASDLSIADLEEKWPGQEPESPVKALRKIKVWDSEYTVGGTLDFSGSAELEGMVMLNLQTVALVTNNHFGYNMRGSTEVHVVQLGRDMNGKTITQEGKDDTPTPGNRDKLINPSKELTFERESTLRRASVPDIARTEKLAMDKSHITSNEFVAYIENTNDGTLDVFKRSPDGDERDFATRNTSSKFSDEKFANAADEVYLEDSPWRPLGIDTCDNLIAFSAPVQEDGLGEVKDGYRAGRVVVGVRTANDEMRWMVEATCGYVPDILTFSDDCSYILVPNAGGGEDFADDNQADIRAQTPPSITMLELDVNRLKQADGSSGNDEPIQSEDDDLKAPGTVIVDPGDAVLRIKDLRFDEFDTDELSQKGVHLGGTGQANLDLIPEGTDIILNQYGYVALQINNAFMVVDLEEGEITQIQGLSYKDISRDNHGMDLVNDGEINIATYGSGAVRAILAPDHTRSYTAIDGETYVIAALEGSDFDLLPGNNQTRNLTKYRTQEENEDDELVSDEVEASKLLILGDGRDATDEVQNFLNSVGEVEVSRVLGYNEAESLQEQVYVFGARSFGIMHWTGQLVFESGDAIEQIIKKEYSQVFNSESPEDEENFNKSQSDLQDELSLEQGPEVEAIELVPINGRMYTLVTSSSSSVIFLFDVTDPRDVRYVDSIYTHVQNEATGSVFGFDGQITTEDGNDVTFPGGRRRQGELDPEGLQYDPSTQRLLVTGAIGSTFSTFKINSQAEAVNKTEQLEDLSSIDAADSFSNPASGSDEGDDSDSDDGTSPSAPPPAQESSEGQSPPGTEPPPPGEQDEESVGKQLCVETLLILLSAAVGLI